MLKALSVRDFRLLWGARLISSLGSWLLVIAVPAHVFLVTGSVLATGLTLFAEYLPAVLLGPYAGVLADRWDRRRLMLSTDVFRAIVVALLLFARSPDTIWIVYLVLFTESTGTVLFRPAVQAHTPTIVGTGELLSSANALNAVADGTVRLAGGPLGAMLMALAGFEVLIWVDVGSYVVSAVMIAMTRPRPRGTSQEPVDIAGGLRALRNTRMAIALLAIMSAFLLANASLSALIIPFGLQRLGSTQHLGLVVAALGVGFLLGAPAAKALIDRIQPKYVLLIGLTVTASAYFALFRSSSLVMALPAGVLVGAAGSITLATQQTVLQRIFPTSVLGRVSAAFFTAEAVATLCGALIGPAIAEAASLSTAAIVASGITLLAGLACLAINSVDRPVAAALASRE